MRLPLSNIFLSLLVILIFYGCSTGPFSSSKGYNWNLELTKPLDYDIAIHMVKYTKEGTEIIRNTSMNSFSGWSGISGGTVLHSPAEAYLPDSISISWEENHSKISYLAKIAFPQEEAIKLWNENYKMQQEKWGSDYPKGALSLKLGLAPGGIINLWLNDLDINTSGFSLLLASYTANRKDDIAKQNNKVECSFSDYNKRYGQPHFYPFEEENIVSIYTTYYNGETNTMSMKNENGSVLTEINGKRGWALAKEITVVWFDKKGQGYKSKYKIDFSEFSDSIEITLSENKKLIYLLDKENSTQGEWHKFTDAHIFQLSEVDRKSF